MVAILSATRYLCSANKVLGVDLCSLEKYAGFWQYSFNAAYTETT
jgi:hypothetical protein